MSFLPPSSPYASSPPTAGGSAYDPLGAAGAMAEPGEVITVHVPTLEAKDLAEARLAVSRAPGTAAMDRRARHRLWGCLAIVAILFGPVVGSGNRPDLTLAGVLLGFIAGVLVIQGGVRKEAEEVAEATYWFDRAGVRWQTPSMEGRASWTDLWMVEGHSCLVLVKGNSFIHPIPKRLARPDLVARVCDLALPAGAVFDPKPLGSTTFA